MRPCTPPASLAAASAASQPAFMALPRSLLEPEKDATMPRRISPCETPRTAGAEGALAGGAATETASPPGARPKASQPPTAATTSTARPARTSGSLLEAAALGGRGGGGFPPAAGAGAALRSGTSPVWPARCSSSSFTTSSMTTWRSCSRAATLGGRAPTSTEKRPALMRSALRMASRPSRPFSVAPTRSPSANQKTPSGSVSLPPPCTRSATVWREMA